MRGYVAEGGGLLSGTAWELAWDSALLGRTPKMAVWARLRLDTDPHKHSALLRNLVKWVSVCQKNP